MIQRTMDRGELGACCQVNGVDLYSDRDLHHCITDRNQLSLPVKVFTIGMLGETREIVLEAVDHAAGTFHGVAGGTLLCSGSYQVDRYGPGKGGWACEVLCDKRALERVDFS